MLSEGNQRFENSEITVGSDSVIITLSNVHGILDIASARRPKFLASDLPRASQLPKSPPL
jgi:hypothetical protein